ncbi:salivary secreted ribonuclease [Culex quinquefasciatus]|uniref:Salivary secreted ribonuclease n=1 Tax=Culex quinquefasciatus TaxID=7176 RepID=B0VZA4_CULQU|nr:ribonuclease kappa [Culex quinquefasciatus]XP_039437301.1 ribonuclease kappa [Culex pipiens pallens]EDS25706.1 salivary secreted ribonuclease [Culex quinquefasciatus]|eukprot:XP_001841753.1 salivary secreted ribonuclease [Culex quinquefasciatus]
MPFCGPKLSLCGLIISVWGIIQLLLMGVFYYIHSVALIEDLPLEAHYPTPADFYAAADRAYSQNAYNCWIAACIYVVTLVVSGQQFYANSRTTVA